VQDKVLCRKAPDEVMIRQLRSHGSRLRLLPENPNTIMPLKVSPCQNGIREEPFGIRAKWSTRCTAWRSAPVHLRIPWSSNGKKQRVSLTMFSPWHRGDRTMEPGRGWNGPHSRVAKIFSRKG